MRRLGLETLGTDTFQFFKPLSVSFTRIDSRERRIAKPLALGRHLRGDPNGTAGGR